MPEDTRTEKLEAAFAEPSEDGTKVGTLRLRPFSLGTLNVCRQLGLTLFLEGEADLDDEEKQRQIVAFAWAQSAPLPEVLDALRTKSAADRIAEFEFRMDVGDLPLLIQEIQRISELAAAAAVEVAPKPGRSGEEDAPPNY
ncbi:MAG: hypothetical protein KDM63_18565 [Verrucomicrobiae bacterium]|nr:hypothetical protein [Verrucomicrobiae bacterium]